MNRRIQQFKEKYEAFGYGEDHLLFACHAAFPTGVTVHMLYQLWANFSLVPGRNRPIDPIVISDFLLSSLVRETSLGIFEMRGGLRQDLLDLLKSDQRFGEKRLEALAFFLYQYIQRNIQERDFDTFRENQYWTALAVIAPHRAAREIGEMLSKNIRQEDSGEILRLNQLLEQIGQEEKSFENILHYSRGLRDGLLERPGAATESFNKVMVMAEANSEDQLSIRIPLLKSIMSDEVQFRRLPGLAQRRAQELAKEQIQKAIQDGASVLRLSSIPFLEQLPDTINRATELKELYLENSNLKEFPDLSGLAKLELLHLANNEIQSLRSSYLPANLLLLSIPNNALSQLDGKIFHHRSLQGLLLKNNQLTMMPEEFLGLGSQLSELDLGNNPWLNLPLPASMPQALEVIQEHWSPIPSSAPCIQLFGLGYLLGENLQDLKDRFLAWEENGQLAFQAKLIFYRYGIFQFGNSRNADIPILYFGGADFQLAIDENQERVELLSPADFAKLLANRASFTRLVILNLPNGGAYAEALLQEGFPAVLAAPGDLNEAQLFGFQEVFFSALLAGQSLRLAVEKVFEAFSNGAGSALVRSKVASDSGIVDPPWKIYEADGTRVNWTWQLPQLPAQSMSTNEGSPNHLKFWREEQKEILDNAGFSQSLESLEAHLLSSSIHYLKLVAISSQYHYLNNLKPDSRLSQEIMEKAFTTLRESLLVLIEGIQADELRANLREERPTGGLAGLVYQWYGHLRKNEWSALWSLMDERLKPTLLNFERYQLEWKYHHLVREWVIDSGSLIESLKQRSLIVQSLIDFIRDLEEDQVKENSEDSGIATILEYFQFSVLHFLPKGDTLGLLHYINDNLASSSGLSNQISSWEKRLRELEDKRRDRRTDLETLEKAYDSLFQEWRSFLSEELSESWLRADYLENESNQLEQQIKRLRAQKAVDFSTLDRLEQQGRWLEKLRPNGEYTSTNWEALVSCYEPLAENRLLEAADRLLHQVEAISHPVTERVSGLRNRLRRLEKEEKKLSFLEYSQEKNEIVKALVQSIGEVLADAELPEPRPGSDLKTYLLEEVDHLIKAGQLKEAFYYLREVLAPASAGLENLVELSASFFHLEAAQYKKEIEYDGVVKELGRFERFLYSVLDADLLLRHDFITWEKQRLQTAIKESSKTGQSKNYDFRKDSDYRRHREALAFLSRFK